MKGKGLVSQQRAILRYIGKYAGLYPQDPFKALLVDEFMDACEDLVQILLPSFMEKDEELKLKMRNELTEPESPFRKQLANLEKRLIHNGGPYAVGGSLTIADIILAQPIEFDIRSGSMQGIPNDILVSFPSPPLRTTLLLTLTSFCCQQTSGRTILHWTSTRTSWLL